MKSFELNLNLNNFLLYNSKINSFKVSRVRNKEVDNWFVYILKQ